MIGRFTKYTDEGVVILSRREDALCEIPFCMRTVYLAGLCRGHWNRTHLGRQKRL